MDSATKLATAWLEKCLSEHTSCKKTARLCTVWSSDNMLIVRDLEHKDKMPRRLLSFAAKSPELSEGDYVRLVDLRDTSEEIPYFALSHRWGTNETCRATKSNLSSLQQSGIILADLPKTFSDAVVLTRALGYSHLWIDSLCIVQDDKQDWKDEAPRMAVVYGNAVCTISAMDAMDSDGGLFISHMISHTTESVREGLETRAWVCQERMISPRSLQFTNNSVSWECRECSQPPISATVTTDLGESRLAPKQIFSVFRDFRVPGMTINEDQHEFMSLSSELIGTPDDYTPFMLAWWQFVSLYSLCNITHESDRFLAMNGVAALTQRWTLLRNTWGLWHDFLEKDLLWYIEPTRLPSRRPKKWLAPSWSWASTVQGKAVNDYYSRLPVKPLLMMKPQITVPVGTSFDQELPIPAWRGREHHGITLSGDLRSGEVITTLDEQGNKHHEIIIDSTGRFSDAEEHDFRPDVASEFEIGQPVKVACLHIHHYDAEPNFPKNMDIRLVLVHVNANQEIHTVVDEVPLSDILDERTMRRVGYLETTYDSMRDYGAIYEDQMWRVMRLI